MTATAKRTRKPLTETPEQREKRLKVWKHNAFMGHAAMMARNANNILEAETTSYHAKALARRIQELSSELAEALKTRIDLPLPAS